MADSFSICCIFLSLLVIRNHIFYWVLYMIIINKKRIFLILLVLFVSVVSFSFKKIVKSLNISDDEILEFIKK